MIEKLYSCEYKPFLLLALSIILLPVDISAQAVSETYKPSEYYSSGDSLMALKKYNEAFTHIQAGISFFKSAQNWQMCAIGYNKIAEGHLSSSQYDLSLDYAKRSLKLNTSKALSDSLKADTYEIMGDIYWEQEKDDQALEAHIAALNLRKKEWGERHLKVARAYLNIATICRYTEKYNEAIENFQKAIGIEENIHGSKHKSVALAYKRLGVCHAKRGDLGLALEHFQKALAIEKQLYAANDMNIARSYGNLGLLYRDKGDYDIALEYSLKAASLFKENQGEDGISMGYFYYNTAHIHVAKGDYQLAIDYGHNAIRILKEYLGDGHNTLGRINENIGIAYENKSEPDQALQYYNKSRVIFEKNNYNSGLAILYINIGHLYVESDLKLAEEYYTAALEKSNLIFEQKHPYVSNIHNALGLIEFRKTNYRQAINYYQKAIIANVVSFHDTAFYSLPNVEGYLDPIELLQSLTQKGNILTAYYGKSQKIEDLQAALKTFERADQLIDKMREEHGNYADKVALADITTKTYEGSIKTCLKLFEITQDKLYREQAFFFMEKSKASVLKAAISDLAAKGVGGLPESLLSFEQALKVDKSFFQSQILNAKTQDNVYDTARVAQWEDELFNCNRRYDSLYSELEKQYPKYYELKHKNKVIGLEQLQRKLLPEEGMVEYFFGDDYLYVFIISQDLFEVIKIDNDSTLESDIEQLRSTMQVSRQLETEDAEYRQYIHRASMIFDKILAKPLKILGGKTSIKKLTIIPDGILSYIPFDILITEDLNDKTLPNYTKLPYLIHDYSTSYGYSSTLLYNGFKNSIQKEQQEGLISFAPEYMPSASFDSVQNLVLGNFRDEVSPLKWNQSEANIINNYIKGRSFTGPNAVEKYFKAEAANHSIIHLAAHALIDDKNPMHSKLVFTQNKDSLEDGYLHAYEIYNMNLPSDLTVLSACNTGFGKLARGEGIMSLARAFSYAGCPSIVMSHWSVDDEATAQLMELFYKNLSGGLSKDIALRQAKLDYLKNASPDKMHPRYWASFVVLGDTSPIIKDDRMQWLWWLMGSLLVLVISISILFNRRKK